MRDPRYSKPFPNWQSAIASLGLLFLTILSLSIPLGSLARYMSPAEFTNISMYSTYTAIALNLTIFVSMLGINFSRYVITVLFSAFAIAALLGHIYYYDAIGWKNLIAAGMSIFVCIFSIKLVNSKMYKSFIIYRKKHIQSGREMVERIKHEQSKSDKS